MNELGLVASQRNAPLVNFGAPGVQCFDDLEVDGTPLLRLVEAAAGAHLDVVSALTSEFPSGAVQFLDDLLGLDDLWRVSMASGARPDELPIYFCPIDYDLDCGGIVATLERSSDEVRLSRFRHVSWDEVADARLTAGLAALDFVFARAEVDVLLQPERMRYVEQAKTWSRPDWQVGALRRLVRRVRRAARRSSDPRDVAGDGRWPPARDRDSRG